MTVSAIDLRMSSQDFVGGRMIEGEKIRFATVDVGDGHFWVRIRSWTHGGESMGIHAGHCLTEQELVDKIAKYGVNPQCVFVDLGWEQTETAEVCWRNGWRGVKGDGKRKQGWETRITKGPRKGQTELKLYGGMYYATTKTRKRVEVWQIATSPLQYILQRLIEGKGARWEVENDAPPLFAKHLNNERLIIEKGIPKWERFGNQHFRDTEIYQLALALMAGAFLPSRQDEAEAAKAMEEKSE